MGARIDESLTRPVRAPEARALRITLTGMQARVRRGHHAQTRAIAAAAARFRAAPAGTGSRAAMTRRAEE
jgi:hypothetical protein